MDIKPMGKIKLNNKIENVGQVTDINGDSWEIVSIWTTADYVTACKTSEILEDYSRFRPYEVEVINEINKNNNENG